MPIIDGLLEFDLRTTLSSHLENHQVKTQKGWLDAVYTLCQEKSSNMQLQIGVFWSYKYLSKLSPELVLDLIEKTCNAMTDIVSLIKADQGKNQRRTIASVLVA
jgi:hypothetical protein